MRPKRCHCGASLDGLRAALVQRAAVRPHRDHLPELIGEQFAGIMATDIQDRPPEAEMSRAEALAELAREMFEPPRALEALAKPLPPPKCDRCGAPLEQAIPGEPDWWCVNATCSVCIDRCRACAGRRQSCELRGEGGWVPDLQCFSALCPIGRINQAQVGMGWVRLLDPTAPDDASPASGAGPSVPAAHLSSTRQHFSDVMSEEGEKSMSEPVASQMKLDDMPVAKVGLETASDTPPQEAKKPRGRPKKEKASESLQQRECRDGGDGTRGRSPVGPSQVRPQHPALGVAMGAQAAAAMLDVAREQLGAAVVQATDLGWAEKLWADRATFHLVEAAKWLSMVRAFCLEGATLTEVSPVMLVLGGQRYAGTVRARCARWVLVERERTDEELLGPMATFPWWAWFDGQTGAWLADGGQPDAWSDRVMLDVSTLPPWLQAGAEGAGV